MTESQKDFLENSKKYGLATEFALLLADGTTMECRSLSDAVYYQNLDYVDVPGQPLYPDAIVIQRDTIPWRAAVWARPANS